MTLFHIIVVLFSCAVGVFAGSKCPDRSSIHPCSCINIHLSKRKFHTTVVCHGLQSTDSLNAILPTLISMEIDKFLIYDSFWKADMLGAAGETQKVLPNDWMTLTNIKEIEIFDSTLSSCFACQWSLICRNSVTTMFKVVNSTSSDKICSLCDTGRGSRAPWMACMMKLEHVVLAHGKLKSVPIDFFPLAMRELKILNLSYNQIVKIDPNAFRNLPGLRTLDLSHNLIEHIDHTFGQRTELEYLDVSHNAIKTVGGDLIPLLSTIKSLNFAYNEIVELKQSDWRRGPSTLRNIDFTGNFIRCDCSIKWINSTLPVYVNILGGCSTPDEFSDSQIRAASRHLVERCDASGNIGSRKKKTTQRSRT